MIRWWNNSRMHRRVVENHVSSMNGRMLLPRRRSSFCHHRSLDHRSCSLGTRTMLSFPGPQHGGCVGDGVLRGPAADRTAAFLSMALRSHSRASTTFSFPRLLPVRAPPRSMISLTQPSLLWPMTATRVLGTKVKKKGQNNNKRKGNNNKKETTKEQQRQKQWEKDQQKKKRRMGGLHPAAKMKRILNYCDYLFGRDNLPKDPFYREELIDYHGHVRISALALGPFLEHWGDDPDLICRALRSPSAERRYRVVFNRAFVEAATRNRKKKQQRAGNARMDESRTKDLRRVAADGKIDLRNTEARDNEEGEEEEVSLPIVDDGSNDFYFALLRPKKLKPKDYMPSETGDDGDNDEGDNDNNFFRNGYDGDSSVFDSCDDPDTSPLDETDPPSEEEERKLNKVKKKGNHHLKEYSSNRNVRVIKNAKQLNAFCRDLKMSLVTENKEGDSGDPLPPPPAVGFDVEYCSLEMDFRTTLPAMLQLASPDPEGPVGLVWLDKFPDHGRDMVFNPEYEDLISLLSTSDIFKVGVGTGKDAKHLAAWWGIPSPDDRDYYLSGMVDLESGWDDDRVGNKSLQEMCETVLDRRLPKSKERNPKRTEEKRKKGRKVKTSHWRRDELTKEMIEYAANDASCAIDVWQRIRQTAAATDA